MSFRPPSIPEIIPDARLLSNGRYAAKIGLVLFLSAGLTAAVFAAVPKVDFQVNVSNID